MSTTASMHTIASAIVAAEKAFLGPDRQWRSVNDMQGQFLAKVLGPARAELAHIPELETIAALSEVPINEFLEKKGFSIKLDEFPKLTPPERAWGAAIFDDQLMTHRCADQMSEQKPDTVIMIAWHEAYVTTMFGSAADIFQ